jgi:alpha-L-arabinofuranosidase
LPVLVLMLWSCTEETPTEGIIQIDGSKKGAYVPSSLYGVFFEEINHAGDGGLYAELVQNRSFEEKEYPEGYTAKGDKLYPAAVKNHLSGTVSESSFRWNEEECPGWSLSTTGPDKARMQLTKDKPLHPGTPNSLKISIPESASEVTLFNGGYWGMGLKAGENYHLRFYLRTESYHGAVKVRLRSSSGKTLAESTVKMNASSGWNEYKLTLVPVESDAKAGLALSFSGQGTVWVDYVSLFPENTFRNRPNGLRKDVAEFLADLRPAFVRWPGGCIVEGISLNNRVEWKKTLGDPMTRPGEYDTWGYRNSYGFGYHEFLQYCEDIGAQGMFVCNIGIGCQARTGDACDDSEVQFYIDDVMDAIEYAIGDQSTEWGAQRAAAGHPEPFPLQYVEIGNENSGPVYNQRYDLFYAAIKSKYPGLTLISNHGLGDDVRNIAKTDMIDPHWYVRPDYFFKNAGIFDKQPRGDFKIYVGEYACNSGVGSGNMLAALSEAAFITGMERNSDLVTMASYAPLFENSNDRTWPVNLIWINSTQVMGRSSYYVQKMAAENRPTYNLNTRITPRPALPLLLHAGGSAGVGTWQTQSEYKDFRITLDDGTIRNPAAGEWVKIKGDWIISDTLMAQTSDETMTSLIWNQPFSGNYSFELKARKTGGNEGFLICFGMSDDHRKGYLFNIGGWMNTLTALETVSNGTTAGIVSEQVPHTIETGRWYDIKVAVTEKEVALFMDGKLIINYKPVSPLHQFAISGYDEVTGEVIIKVVNADDMKWNTSIRIIRAGRILGTGKVVTLSASSLDDENSFEEPMKISPRITQIDDFSSKFDYSFEPASFTILRLKVAGKAAGN